LFKQDIIELIQIFQNNLQDVEIIIDDIYIVDGRELEQFDTVYQARSLTARGSYHEDTKPWSERQFIELKMNREGATLLLDRNNPEKIELDVSTQISKVLLRCQNHIQRFLQMVIFYIFICLPISLLPIFQQHHVNYVLELFFVVTLGFLLVLTAFFLFIFIVRLLHIETTVFLFPGAVRVAQTYGLREAMGRLVVALLLFIAFDAILLIIFRILW